MATPTAAAPQNPGARGRMTFSVQRLAQPLLLDQKVIDPTWNDFKTFMVILGGILFFLCLGGGMYYLGHQSAGPSTTSVVRSTAVARPRPAVPASSVINFHVDGDVRVTSPSNIEPSPEQRAEQFKEELRHQYGAR